MDVLSALKDAAPVLSVAATLVAAVIAAWASGSRSRKDLKLEQEVYAWCKTYGTKDQLQKLAFIIDNHIDSLYRSRRATPFFIGAGVLFAEAVAIFILALLPNTEAPQVILDFIIAAVALVLGVIMVILGFQQRVSKTSNKARKKQDIEKNDE